MRPNTKIALCLGIILVLVFAQGGVLLAAGMGNEELIQQLRGDIDLLMGISGAIITVLMTTVGILWKALRSSQREFIETLKTLKEDQSMDEHLTISKKTVEAIITALSETTSGAAAVQLGLDLANLNRPHTEAQILQEHQVAKRQKEKENEGVPMQKVGT